MGTSADFSAPPNWNSDLKAAVTRGGGRTPSAAEARTYVRDFISANGGSTNVASGGGQTGSGTAARATAASLGGFFAATAGGGLTSALRDIGLGDLAGGTVGEILNGLIVRLGGAGGDVDSADAREALSVTMRELCEDARTPDELEEVLTRRIERDGLGMLLATYFANYLYEQFCRVFFSQLISKHGDEKARSFLSEIRNVIRSNVALETFGLDAAAIDWLGSQGRAITQTVMQNVLAIFE